MRKLVSWLFVFLVFSPSYRCVCVLWEEVWLGLHLSDVRDRRRGAADRHPCLQIVDHVADETDEHEEDQDDEEDDDVALHFGWLCGSRRLRGGKGGCDAKCWANVWIELVVEVHSKRNSLIVGARG